MSLHAGFERAIFAVARQLCWKQATCSGDSRACLLQLRKIYKYSKLQQVFVLNAVAGAGRQADLDQAPSLTVASTGVVRRTAMQQSAR